MVDGDDSSSSSSNDNNKKECGLVRNSSFSFHFIILFDVAESLTVPGCATLHAGRVVPNASKDIQQPVSPILVQAKLMGPGRAGRSGRLIADPAPDNRTQREVK